MINVKPPLEFFEIYEFRLKRCVGELLDLVYSPISASEICIAHMGYTEDLTDYLVRLVEEMIEKSIEALEPLDWGE